MSLSHTAQLCAVLAVMISSGPARSQSPAMVPAANPPAQMGSQFYLPTTIDGSPAAHPSSSESVVSQEEIPAAVPSGNFDLPFAGDAELSLNRLVEEVQSRNPTVQSIVASWRAAAQRYPQAVALDDPMFGYMLGPDSWGDPTLRPAYMLEASQKLPWPGKRRLRGNVAQAEANAAYFDVGEERLRVAQATRMAYYDYFLADRQLTVLEESRALLQSFRDIAKTKYESAVVEQQDVLLADVELGEIDRQRLMLERQASVAQARINTLLLLAPDAPLPPPPHDLPVDALAASADELRTMALAQRPELAAQEARIRAERYSIELACKEFYPDMEIVGRYDAFWQEDPLRPMVGMNVNVPIYVQKRRAAVREARSRLAQQQAALEAQINEISFEVEQAYQGAMEAKQSVQIYRDRLLPSAEQSTESARASYLVGKLDFLRLVESQRRLLELRENYYAAVAQYHQRLTELERAVGTPPLLQQ